MLWASKRITICNYHYWASWNLSWLSVLPYVMIEYLDICHDRIYWLDLIDPISWFDLISPILWFDWTSPIPLFDLINSTQMIFPSPPCGRWWNILPITFQIILLVRPRVHTKHTRTVYPYIPSSGRYVKPYLAQLL